MTIDKLTDDEKDFLIMITFNLLWQTADVDDWNSILTDAEEKRASELFNIIDEE